MTTRVPPLLGLLAVATMLAPLALGVTEEPAATASASAAVDYWSSNRDVELLSCALLAVSAASLVGFAVGLREALRPAGARLAAVASTGVAIAATGLLTITGVAFTAADTAGKVAPQVTQTLSALNQDLVWPMAGGFGLMLIAGGIAIARARLLPAWFGWLSVTAGILAFTPGGVIAYILTPIWIAALSGRLLKQPSRAVAAPAEPRRRTAIDLAGRA